MRKPDMEAARKMAKIAVNEVGYEHEDWINQVLKEWEKQDLIDTTEEKTCPKDKCLSWEWCGGYVDEDCIRKSSGEDNFTPKK